MIHEGKPVNRITLTPGVMDTIEYQGVYGFCVDIVNYGEGEVYINWIGDAVIGDSESLLLGELETYELRTELSSVGNSAIKLNLISDSAATIQIVRTVK